MSAVADSSMSARLGCGCSGVVTSAASSSVTSQLGGGCVGAVSSAAVCPSLAEIGSGCFVALPSAGGCCRAALVAGASAAAGCVASAATLTSCTATAAVRGFVNPLHAHIIARCVNICAASHHAEAHPPAAMTRLVWRPLCLLSRPPLPPRDQRQCCQPAHQNVQGVLMACVVRSHQKHCTRRDACAWNCSGYA